jgi:hypothetical protein
MPRVSLAFFLVAALCGLGGMAWGAYMGAQQDFAWRDAHAHLNLVGWVTLSIMGGFYALAGEARPKVLSWINFALSVAGVFVFVAGLAMMAAGSEQQALMALIPGSSLVWLGMAAFAASVVVVLVRKPAG